MSSLQFVNVHGKPVKPASSASAPVKRAKREAKTEYHKGFSVRGIPPGALENAEAQHRNLVEMARGGNTAVRMPQPWDAKAWLNKAKAKKVRSKPYEIESAADECKRAAERAGWLRVEVIAVTKGSAAPFGPLGAGQEVFA